MNKNASTLNVASNKANRFPRARIENAAVSLEKQKEVEQLQEGLAEQPPTEVETQHGNTEKTSEQKTLSKEDAENAFNC